MKSLSLTLLFCLIFSSLALADKPDPLRLCIDYRKAGQLPQALIYCDEAIKEHPANANAWLESGDTLAEAGHYAQAESAWESAVRLNHALGKKVGLKYEKALDNALASGQTEMAKTLAKRLISYQPGRREPLSDKYLKTGLKQLAESLRDQARPYLTIAVYLNPNLRSPVYNAYIKKGNQAPEEEAVFYWGEAIPYSDIRDQGIGKKVFEIGMKYAKKPGAEVLTSKIREILRQYMGEAFIQKEFPELWRAPMGTWDYSGKAGERTPYLTTEAQRCNFQFLSDNKMYTIVYSDGNRYKMWVPEDREKASKIIGNNLKWYLLFQADSTVHLEVKEWKE